MPTNQFLSLGGEKQNNIIQVSITEFAQNGFVNASTNRIVKECGISKGSLFKYFESKEDLYFYVLDIVTGEMLQDIESEIGNLSTELFQRIIDYSALEISWYIKNPVKGRLVIGATIESDEEIRSKTIERYGLKGEDIYYGLLEGIEEERLKQNKDRVVDILKWVLEGFNKDFLEKADIKKESFEQLKEEYIQKLTDYIEILKKGFGD
ncbi:MAG: TetR/AcrR family transcriptional regulator [Lachnospiraceae bacterium]